MEIFKCILFVALFMLGCSRANAQLTWDSKTAETKAPPQDREVRGKFTFNNAGKEPVTIVEILSGCTCVSGTIKEGRIEPGERGEIEFTFELQGRIGKQKKELLVTTDDPEEPRTVLKILVNIE